MEELRRSLMMLGGSKLPPGYYECEYIESRGEYFIDTGFVINRGENWEVELDGQFDEPYTFAGANAYLQYQITTNTRSIFKVTYSNHTTTYYVNGTALKTNNWGSSSTYSNVKLGIFRIGDSNNVWYDTYEPLNGKIYSHKVWKDGNKVFDGIPCVNPEGYFGLYDTVTKTFFRMKEEVLTETTVTVAGATITLGNWSKSTSVTNPDSSSYDGVYESNAISHGEFAMCTLTNIKCSNIYIRSNGESCCDYAYVTNSSGTQIGTTAGSSVSGNLISNYKAVNVSGQSTVYVYYTKDGSVTNGTDKGYLLIPKVPTNTTTTQTVDSIGAGKVIIPDNYITLVNGIYGSNGAYINTNYNPNSNTKVLMQAKLFNATDSPFLFGTMNGAGTSFRLNTLSVSTWQGNFGSGKYVYPATLALNTLLNIEAGLGSLKINDVTASYSNTSYSCTTPLVLFADNLNGSIKGYASMNLYHCAITESSQLKRLLVPCKNSANVYGLYDVVNKVWYPSSSSTAFTNELNITNYDFPYTGAVQSVTLGKGTYKLEVWGAQGGCYSSSTINKGGYSTGLLTLTASTKVYVYVGGQPPSITSGSAGTVNPGGFNGGGSAQTVSYSSTTTYGQGGGGGTDIRLISDSLYNRVIVAGGGAGASDTSTSFKVHGGGITGGDGEDYFGGKQAEGGTGDTYGGFGQGANVVPTSTNYKYAASGAGGGWYGGGVTINVSDSSAYYRYACGGGSGFVWVSGASVPSSYDLSSSYYLTNASTTSGDTAFTSPTGTSETGHAGSGYARITQIS